MIVNKYYNLYLWTQKKALFFFLDFLSDFCSPENSLCKRTENIFSEFNVWIVKQGNVIIFILELEYVQESWRIVE